MKYTVEDIKKILEERDWFKFTTLNSKGEKETFSANILFFENFLIDTHKTKEFCVALQEYDIYNVTPISKIIEIL